MIYFLSICIYLFTFGGSMYISSLYQKSYRKNNCIELSKVKKTLWFTAIIILPVFISAIRYNVGTDYLGYVQWFESINKLPFNTSWVLFGREPLFFWLNKAAFYLFRSEIGLFLLASLLIHLFIIMGIDYFKKHLSIPFSLFIFYMIFFPFTLNGVRQGIAIAIVFFAIRYLIERRSIYFIVFILIASLFHTTAIICICFYFIRTSKKSKIWNAILYLMIFFLPFSFNWIINNASNLDIFKRFQTYIIPTENVDIGLGFLLNILPVLFPIFLLKKQVIFSNNKYENLFSLSLMNFPFILIAYYISWGARMVLYTHTIFIILVPIVVNNVKVGKNKQILFIYFSMYFILKYVIEFIVKNIHETYPYISLIFK